MIVGHGPLAFLLTAALLQLVFSYSPKKILYLATFAGVASVLPDIDVLLPLFSILTVQTISISAITDQFWTVSQEQHRMETHSLIILTLTSLTAVLTQLEFKYKPALAFIKTIVLLLSPFPLSIKLLLGSTIIAFYIFDKYKPANVSLTELTTVFITGALLHPFGDMFTGDPPLFTYPLTSPLELSRWTLADPTLQFALIFLLEVGTLLGTLLVINKLTTDTYFTLPTASPKLKHTAMSLSFVGLLLLMYGSNKTPTVDSATFFVFPLVGLAALGNSYSLYKDNLETYLTDISWVLALGMLFYLSLYLIVL